MRSPFRVQPRVVSVPTWVFSIGDQIKGDNVRLLTEGDLLVTIKRLQEALTILQTYRETD